MEYMLCEEWYRVHYRKRWKYRNRLNWEEYYKELEKGKYRILMQVIPGDDNTIISTEFEVK